MHWPQALLENGALNMNCDLTYAYGPTLGDALQPDESPTYIDTWKDMEQLFKSGACRSTFVIHRPIFILSCLGKARSIGVSNFSVKTLTHLLNNAQVVPAVNQVEAHPCLPQHGLLKFCRQNGIHLTAYSPVGKHKFASHEAVVSIAQHHGVTAAQILLSWGVQRGTSVIPKTESAQRLSENITVSRPFTQRYHSRN